MRLGIMQPYFFPYLGHFSLIAASDEWIVFDVTQYAKRGWMNRNRMLHPGVGWQWVTVPLAQASMHMRSHQARILDPAGARQRIVAQLSHYRRAPHYAAVVGLLDQAFDGAGDSLVELNVRGLRAVCRHIGLPFRARIASGLELGLPEGLGAGDWAPAICSALRATGYVNPEGGRGLFDPAAFARRGVDLRFLQAEPFTYRTGRFGFEPGLSVLDTLMWNDRATVRDAVLRFSLRGPVMGDGVVPGPGATVRRPRAAVPEPALP